MHWLATFTGTLRDSSVGLMALKNVVVFASGVGSTMLYYRWKDKRDDVSDPDHAPHSTQFRKLWIVAAIGVALFMFIAVRTQVSADHSDTALAWTRQQAADAKNQAQHNKECFNHLADVLRRRGDLSDAIDPALQKQIDDLGHWLHDIGAPPKDIADTHTTDQPYQDYIAMVNDKYFKLLDAERAAQEASAMARKADPVPDPGCTQ